MQIRTISAPQIQSRLTTPAFAPTLKPEQADSPAVDGFRPGFSALALQSPAPEAKAPSPLLKRIEKMVGEALADPAKEKELISTLQKLNAAGQLKPTLHQLAQLGMESGALPPLPPEKISEGVETAANMIDAQFRERGMTPDTQGVVYKDWATLSAEHLAKVRNSQAPPRQPGGLSLFTDKTFLSELESLQGAKFRSGNSITPLMDGPASFAERDRMIDGAKESINMMSWAIYDDETGWDTARKLVKKAEEGVTVRVIVDGQTAAKTGYGDAARWMKENGVSVDFWRDSDRPYDGNHRKLLSVDGQEAVVGGINIGNVYSHRTTEDKWRDTDVLVQGPAVTDGERMFADVWNAHAEKNGYASMERPAEPAAVSGGMSAAVVNHNPGPDGDSHIMLSMIKAIEGATESVDMEQAYFINTPGVKDALMKALDAGVKVRILTNSAESIDEAIMAYPILASLPEMLEAGAEIYLKKGPTLHSKFMTVDGMFTQVGSHNHHPRSERFEGEMVINAVDPNLTRSFTESFEKDIAAAKRCETVADIGVPEPGLGALALKYFFDAF